MVQREVAERIAAPPGAMSYLSVFVQYHADVRVAARRAGARRSSPRRRSTRRCWSARRGRAASTEEAEERPVAARPGRLPRAAQDAPQRAAAPAAAGRPRAVRGGAGARCGIAPDRRPQTLSVDEWMALRGRRSAPLEPMTRRRRRPRGPRRAARAAKVNLGLAVTGRRAGRLPRARSVFVRARRSPTASRSTPRSGPAARPPRRSTGDPRLPDRGTTSCSARCDALRAARRRTRIAGARLPPRQAHPDRRPGSAAAAPTPRPRSSSQLRAWGVGSARRAPRRSPRGSARTCRSSPRTGRRGAGRRASASGSSALPAAQRAARRPARDAARARCRRADVFAALRRGCRPGRRAARAADRARWPRALRGRPRRRRAGRRPQRRCATPTTCGRPRPPLEPGAARRCATRSRRGSAGPCC